MTTLDSLKTLAAKQGYSFAHGAPSPNHSSEYFATMITQEPETGELDFEMPDDFTAFLDGCGLARLEDAEGSLVFEIGTQAEFVMELAELTHIPDGVTWETESGQEVAIATHHLVPFALCHMESTWCFDTSSSPYRVVRHQQDEPIHARDRMTSKHLDLGPDQSSSFASFSDWLGFIETQLSKNVSKEFLWE